MNHLQKFLIEGKDQEIQVPSLGSVMPCTMQRIASVQHVEFAPHELGTIIRRTQQFLDDAEPSYLEMSIGEELHTNIQRSQGRAFMVGQAHNEPQGVFRNVLIERKQSELTADHVIDFMYMLLSSYRRKAAFLCSEFTVKKLKRLQDSEGRFLYQEGLTALDPGTLLGYPVHTDPDAPEGELMFGNFEEGYLIQGRPFITILRDPFSQKPYVLFHAIHKIGGQVNNAQAIKILEFPHGNER